jgi:hypothetical protein
LVDLHLIAAAIQLDESGDRADLGLGCRGLASDVAATRRKKKIEGLARNGGPPLRSFAGDSSRHELRRVLTEAGKVYSGSGVAQQSMLSAEKVFLAKGSKVRKNARGLLLF